LAQTPDADVKAIRQCVAAIEQSFQRGEYVSVSDVKQIDRRIAQALSRCLL
jgi:hypothetical protein